MKALIITWENFQDQEVVYPYYRLKEEITPFTNGLELVWHKKGEETITGSSPDVFISKRQ